MNTVAVRDQSGADALIDLAFWQAACAAEIHPLPMSLASPDDWICWLNRLDAECRGYWHGRTGRIFERLGLPKEEWRHMCRIRDPEPPKSIGDSSMDYFYLLIPPGLKDVARFGRTLDGREWPESPLIPGQP